MKEESWNMKMGIFRNYKMYFLRFCTSVADDEMRLWAVGARTSSRYSPCVWRGPHCTVTILEKRQPEN